jgi:hypothetical protein
VSLHNLVYHSAKEEEVTPGLMPAYHVNRYMGVSLEHMSRPDKQLQSIMYKLFPKVFGRSPPYVGLSDAPPA